MREKMIVTQGCGDASTLGFGVQPLRGRALASCSFYCRLSLRERSVSQIFCGAKGDTYFLHDAYSFTFHSGDEEMADITNRRLIITKGFLFLFLGLFASVFLICLTLSWQVTILQLISIWSFCRFYYFAFYVIQHYVDNRFRFTGLVDFAKCFLQGKLPCKSTDSTEVISQSIE